jgi:hypothetical protein
MAKLDLREVKGIRNADFYPVQFFTGGLAQDAKDKGFDPKRISNLRKEMVKALENLGEPGRDVQAQRTLREGLISQWFKILGYYDRPGENEVPGLFDIDGKQASLTIHRRVALHGDGQIWLISDLMDTIAVANDQEASESTGDVEHFYERLVKVQLKDKARQFTWEKVLEQIFDADQSAAEWIIINQGDRLIVVERGRWQESKAYLEVDVAELLSINLDDTYRMVLGILSAEAFPIDSADSFHDDLEKNAHKKATEVTKALRDTVKNSIEILANAVLAGLSAEDKKSMGLTGKADRRQRQDAAQQVFEQSLLYIYRMLFMFFAESQERRQGALPVHAKIYQKGYSLEHLRDLEYKPLLDGEGTFIFETLERAFSVYFDGYNHEHKVVYDEHTDSEQIQTDALGFAFPRLGTDLFSSARTPLISKIKIPDSIMQEVIRNLSLAKTGTGTRARTHRVHYASLGLNQLGAVYEGLLALKPEILEEDSFLLKREGKEIAHRFVPVSLIKSIDSELLEVSESGESVRRSKGEFLLTPVGLDRKFSASFYTPEVLTRFLAKEAVERLLAEDASLTKMENLKIMEPAMGSGAFLNAVVDEIAPRMANFYYKTAKDAYEAVREKKGDHFRKEDAPPLFPYAFYHTKAKDHLMRHCVYGVDLNSTAVELAKISLWLNCLHNDGNLPFLDFKLRAGNSLVGCWITRFKNCQSFQHFLLPPGDALNTLIDTNILGKKDMPLVAGEKDRACLKDLRGKWTKSWSDKALKPRLAALSAKIEALYGSYAANRSETLGKIRVAATGAEKDALFKGFLANNHAYYQLRTMMDYWCSLWYWPVEQINELPTLEDYIGAIEWLAESKIGHGGEAKRTMLRSSGYGALEVSWEIALKQTFFHWDLEYADIFAAGGFDLVLGNPPWAPVYWEEKDFFEELKPGLHAVKEDSKGLQDQYVEALENRKGSRAEYGIKRVTAEGFANFLKNSGTYGVKDRSQTNTYRYFFQRFREAANKGGKFALIAQDGIFSDKGCLDMRVVAYRELERFYRFHNGKRLFEDVHSEAQYLISFSEKEKHQIAFELVDNLFHPDTINKCRAESRQAPYPGIKDDLGNIELRGHPLRIVRVDDSVLNALAKFEGIEDHLQTKLPIIHGSVELALLQRLAEHPKRIAQTEWYYWRQFDESGAPKAGLIKRAPGRPKSLRHAVMTGPNVFVGHPANKIPNPGCKNKTDFSEVDLTSVPDDYFPDSVYQATEAGIKSREYLAETSWGTTHAEQYRIIARRRVNTTGVRTLSSAIIPPGPTHVHTCSTMCFRDPSELLESSGLFNSLVLDFFMRSLSGGEIVKSIVSLAPLLTEFQKKHPLLPALKIRALRLSCISTHYDDLWTDSFAKEFQEFEVNSKFAPKLPYSKLPKKWKRDCTLRTEEEREQALCEIDAIVAILFDFDKDTLLNLYRAQFGVLQKNLQDLPNQIPNPEKYHFPRHQAMAEAYDQAMKFADSKGLKKAS